MSLLQWTSFRWWSCFCRRQGVLAGKRDILEPNSKSDATRRLSVEMADYGAGSSWEGRYPLSKKSVSADRLLRYVYHNSLAQDEATRISFLGSLKFEQTFGMSGFGVKGFECTSPCVIENHYLVAKDWHLEFSGALERSRGVCPNSAHLSCIQPHLLLSEMYLLKTPFCNYETCTTDRMFSCWRTQCYYHWALFDSTGTFVFLVFWCYKEWLCCQSRLPLFGA